MSLTRKYYRMIAQVIKNNTIVLSKDSKEECPLYVPNEWIDKHKLINDLSKEFKRDNINFNYTTFEDACK